MIEGVKITNLKIISDERGKVMHMLRSDSSVLKKFGEIYFSTIYLNIVKGWHLHLKSTLNYVCIKGEVKLVLFDDRKKSSTNGKFQEIILSPKIIFWYQYLLISGMVSKALLLKESIIANCLDNPHDENEMIRKITMIIILNLVGKKIFNMKCIILAGGKGSRLSELTKSIPKPMVKFLISQ